jgi:hypothetical protein
MSLISDALKKAQRQRTGPDTVPPIPGVSRAARTEPSSSQSMVWIIAGAVGLVVVAVGLTIFFLRPKAGAPAPALPSLAMAKSAAAPAADSASPPATVPVIPAPAPVVVSRAPASPIAATPVITEPAASPADAASPSGQPVTTKRTKNADADPRIIAFVDAIRVTGIRSSGTDSKVLMNDKVFRVNDIVERMLNVRLTAVDTDSLTFVDENGVVYTKNF